MKKKYRVVRTIPTYMGTLYEGDIVTLVNKDPEGGLRIRDATGRPFLISEKNLEEIKT